MKTRAWTIGAAFAVASIASIALPQRVEAAELKCKEIRWIVPFAPGGGVDWLTRLVVDPLSQRLNGMAIIIENRAGASGAIGAQVLARSAPDGCNVMSMSSSMAVAQALLGPKAVGYDLVKDFEPVINMASTPYFIAANASLNVKTFPELMAAAKAQPGKIPYGTSGTASMQALVYSQIQKLAGVKMVEVPYKGGGEMYSDFLSGRVPLFLAFPYEVQSYVDEKKVYYLAATSAKRHPLLPDVPTVAETLPGFDISNSYGVVAPAGAPKDVIAQLNREIAAVLHSSAIKEKLEKETSYLVDAQAPEIFRQQLASSYAYFLQFAP